MDEETQKAQISLFYRYLKPVHTSWLAYDKVKTVYSAEHSTFTPNHDSFAAETLSNNKTADCFACRNRFEARRIWQNVSFIKTLLVDIDNDMDDSISKRFEELCERHNLFIEAKVRSRKIGGYHYYVAYRPTDITSSNRERIVQLNKNFREWLLDHGVEVDKKIFDLGRLIRIWGTKNHKRDSYCRCLFLHTASEQQVVHNTEFLNSLKSKDFPTLPTPSNFITSCSLIEHIRVHKLNKKNTEKNDKLLKNVAIFLFNLLGMEGLQIGESVAKLQEHSAGEMQGWFNKAKSGELKNFGCGELNLWLKKYYPELMKLTCSKCRILNQNKIEYLVSSESWFDLKKQARETEKLLINREIHIQGIVAPSATPYRQELVIFRKFKDEEQEQIVFFDEKVPKSKDLTELKPLCVDFFAYELIEEGTNYLLLSEKKLDYGEYYIEGSVVKLHDRLKIGNAGTTDTKHKILLLNNAKSLITKVKNHKELFTLLNDISKEDLLNFLFSYYDEEEGTKFIFRQPNNVELLITAFLFSAKYEYPLHLCIYGKQDSGKTSIMKALFEKFNEPFEFVDGSGTTLKGLVPSFAGSVPKLGAILESKRQCAVDEFLRTVKNEEDRDKISMLNNLLLHTKSSTKTGKGDIDARMRSKLFAVTNPLHGCNFEETLAQLPASTMSRILLWKQYKSHYNWVRMGSNKKIAETDKIDKYDFLAVYDYLNSFKVEIDNKKLFSITEELRAKVPNYMTDLYEGRYQHHHSMCLLDGIVKFRCLTTQDQGFKATQEDYDTFNTIWEDLIISWYDNIGAEDSERLLSQEQKAMMKLITDNKDIWDYQLEKLCGEKNISYKFNYKRLLDLKLIEVANRKVNIVEEKDISFESI